MNNELLENINDKPSFRVVDGGFHTIEVPGASSYDFTVISDSFEIIPVNNVFTRISLYKKIGNEIKVIDSWYGSRKPYTFKTGLGEYRVTLVQTEAKIILKGLFK